MEQTSGQSANASRETYWDILTGIVPLAACAPMLVFQFFDLWNRPHFRYFPLVLLAVVALVAIRFGSQESDRPWRRRAALGLFVLSTLVFVVAAILFTPWLAYLAFVGFFVAWGWGRFGQTHWAEMFALGILLCSILPLPYGWDIQLLKQCHQTSLWACQGALDLFDVPNIRTGSVFELRGLRFDIAEVCSSNWSVYFALSFSVAILIISKRSAVMSMLTAACVPVLFIVVQFFKLLIVAIAWESFGRDLAAGRDAALLEFATAVGMLLSCWLLSRAFGTLFEPVPMTDGEYALVFAGMNQLISWPQLDPLSELPPEDPDDRRHWEKMMKEDEARRNNYKPFLWWNLGFSRWSTVAFSFLTFVMLFPTCYILLRDGRNLVRRDSAGIQEIERLAAVRVPLQISDFKLTDRETELRTVHSPLGQVSIVWNYQSGTEIVTCSLSLPFTGFHDAAAVRAQYGWTLVKEEVADTVGPNSRFGELQNPLGGRAYYLYETLNLRTAEIVVPTQAGRQKTLWDLLAGERYDLNQATSCLIVSCESGTRLRPHVKDSMLKMLDEYERIFIGGNES